MSLPAAQPPTPQLPLAEASAANSSVSSVMFTWGVAHCAWLGRPEMEDRSRAFPFSCAVTGRRNHRRLTHLRQLPAQSPCFWPPDILSVGDAKTANKKFLEPQGRER